MHTHTHKKNLRTEWLVLVGRRCWILVGFLSILNKIHFFDSLWQIRHFTRKETKLSWAYLRHIFGVFLEFLGEKRHQESFLGLCSLAISLRNFSLAHLGCMLGLMLQCLSWRFHHNNFLELILATSRFHFEVTRVKIFSKHIFFFLPRTKLDIPPENVAWCWNS